MGRFSPFEAGLPSAGPGRDGLVASGPFQEYDEFMDDSKAMGGGETSQPGAGWPMLEPLRERERDLVGSMATCTML